MSRYAKDYLQHILDEVEYLLISSQNLNKEKIDTLIEVKK